MNLYSNSLYLEDIELVCSQDLPWDKLKDKSILITGATGMIGSFLVDVIMKKNTDGLRCKVFSMGRNEEKGKKRFSQYIDNELFYFIEHDIKLPFETELDIDYVLHLASNTHPMAYATDPIGTITTNIIGIQNILEYATQHHSSRIAFASSNEIYGENRGDVEKFDEEYCGYINCNTMRAGYPESKRCGESLCQAYIKQKGLDVVIPRLTRSYGPTLLSSDTKALSQFLQKGVDGEDIILKSTGTQYYSYTYVADAVYGLLTVLLKGKCGEAYNIADDASDIMLKELAEIIANYVGKRVIFDIPDAIEKSGYSVVTKARLDNSKISQLGWKSLYNIKNGIERTIDMLRESK